MHFAMHFPSRRPITLFTGQWADLTLAELAPLAKRMGYDGLELACWGDHFDVERAATSDSYVRELWELLAGHGLTCFAVSNHLVGQAVCDVIDDRHREILPADVWGDGDPEAVRQRAAQKMITTGKAARAFFNAKPGGEKDKLPAIVNGFTGSSIWHSIYAFPPTSQAYWDGGFADFGKRWRPILDAFDKMDVNFGLEVHPTEIAFDIVTAERALEAVGQHPRFGFNYDPSHLGYQGVDYVEFIRAFGSRIFHAHIKDVWWGKGGGGKRGFRRASVLRRPAALLGIPLAGARGHPVRGRDRRSQRRRLSRAIVGGMGGYPHGSHPRGDRGGGVCAQA